MLISSSYSSKLSSTRRIDIRNSIVRSADHLADIQRVGRFDLQWKRFSFWLQIMYYRYETNIFYPEKLGRYSKSLIRLVQLNCFTACTLST